MNTAQVFTHCYLRGHPNLRCTVAGAVPAAAAIAGLLDHAQQVVDEAHFVCTLDERSIRVHCWIEGLEIAVPLVRPKLWHGRGYAETSVDIAGSRVIHTRFPGRLTRAAAIERFHKYTFERLGIAKAILAAGITDFVIELGSSEQGRAHTIETTAA